MNFDDLTVKTDNKDGPDVGATGGRLHAKRVFYIETTVTRQPDEIASLRSQRQVSQVSARFTDS